MKLAVRYKNTRMCKKIAQQKTRVEEGTVNK